MIHKSWAWTLAPYSLLHRKHLLSHVLNTQWASSDLENVWILRLHSFWSLHLSYKLRVFAWLAIYQRLPAKARLAKSRQMDGLYLVCGRLETVKNILWDWKCARSCWKYVQNQHRVLFQGQLQSRAALFGDSRYKVLSAFYGIWDCLRITALFTIWRLRCKYVFNDKISSSQSFCHAWWEEVCMQLSAKGFLLIKDAQKFEASAYSDFIPAL